MKHIIYYIFSLFATKRWFSAKHDEHDNTHGPYIALCCVAALQNFRGNIIGCSIRLVHHLIRIYFLCQAKVNQFYMAVIVLFIQQEVLRLDITMANPIGVQVAQCVKRLLHD